MECKICGDNFSHSTSENDGKTPIIGERCGHCFCRECLQKAHANIVEETGRANIRRIACFECRGKNFHIEHLTPNRTLCDMLKQSSTTSTAISNTAQTSSEEERDKETVPGNTPLLEAGTSNNNKSDGDANSPAHNSGDGQDSLRPKRKRIKTNFYRPDLPKPVSDSHDSMSSSSGNSNTSSEREVESNEEEGTKEQTMAVVDSEDDDTMASQYSETQEEQQNFRVEAIQLPKLKDEQPSDEDETDLHEDEEQEQEPSSNSVPAEPSPNKSTFHYGIGTKLRKEFVVPFQGEVIGVPSNDCIFYRVKYNDGDKEEIEHYELEPLIIQPAARENKTKKIQLGDKMEKEFPISFEGEVIGRRGSNSYTVHFEGTGQNEHISREDIEPLVIFYNELVKNDPVMDVSETYFAENHRSSARSTGETSQPTNMDDPIVLDKEIATNREYNRHAIDNPGEIVNDLSTSSVDDGDEDEVEISKDSSKGFSHVKLELFNKATNQKLSMTQKDRQRRKKERIAMLKTPDGKPRKVFRRACHPQSITQVLGGQMSCPAPICMNIPTEIFENGINPFIKEGEYYFAGRSDWNPWTPYYPKDSGFIESQWLRGHWGGPAKNNGAFKDRSEQKTFHCFLHCAKKRHQPYYLGPNAKGKRLYLGRYREVPVIEGIEVEMRLYKNLDWESQYSMADCYGRNGCEVACMDIDGTIRVGTNADLNDNHENRAKEFADHDGKSWDKLSMEEQRARKWIEMLLEAEYKLFIRPVEFIDYDEKLYEKLVEIGADNGEVSLNEAELGPF